MGTLSRGMQQKLALCCALVSDPSILLVDEPTLGLDVTSARTIRAKLGLLAKERRHAILLTTHNMQLAAAACDRVGIIDKGRLIREGPPSEFVRALGGSVYVIECRQPIDTATANRLAQIPGLTTNALEATYEIRLPMQGTHCGIRLLYEVIDILRDGHAQLVSIHEAKRTLENAFVHLTKERSDEVSR